MKSRFWLFVCSLGVPLIVSTLPSLAQEKPADAPANVFSGAVPAPWYVPTEKFSPDANQRVALDGSLAPNILTNSRELCGGRGYVQSETSIAVSGDVVVVAFNDSRGFACPNRSTVGWAYSLDGGQTFTDGGTLPGGRTPWSNGDPSVVAAPDGSFYIAGISNSFRGMSVSRGTADANGITWSAPVRAVTGAGTIDKELLAVDQNTGTVYMGYSRSGQIEVVRSEDQGDTWSSPVRLSAGIGAFPLTDANSKLYVSWLVGWPGANQRIVMSSSDDGGQTFTSPVTISNVCIVNVPGFSRGQMPAFPSVAVDNSGGERNGRVYVTWHSSCFSPGDVYLSWSDDGGGSWSEPVTVNDDGTSAIHFSPTASVDDSGTVSVAFYDRRENPGTAVTNVYFAQSFDGGATFTTNLRVTDVATNWAAVRSDITPNMGDYMSSVAVGTDVFVTWSDGREGDPDAYFSRITPGAGAKNTNRNVR